MVLCTFCNKEYKTNRTLKVHQNGKACLKNKPLAAKVIIYDCDLCGKILRNKRNLIEHAAICKVKKAVDAKDYEQLKLRCEELEERNRSLVHELKESNALVLELSKRPTTVINNNDNRNINITIKNYVENSPESVTLETIEGYVPKLTLNHVLNEGAGYAKFYMDEMSNNIRMVTKNEARGIVVYKNGKEKFYKDIGLREFIIIFAQAIKDKAKVLINIFLETMKLDLSEPEDMATMQKYMSYVTDLNLASKGNNARFAPAMLKGITAGTLAGNLLVE